LATTVGPGIGNLFVWVIGVRMKPGEMTETVTPLPRN
jgi:hypothetical protein